MEAKSKGECIERAIDSLLQLQEHYVEAVDWIEKSKAFVPDDSKAVQELKDALAKSTEREEALRGNWVKSEDSRVGLEEALALSEDSRDGLKKNLAKSIELEKELERRLAASFARERRLTSYIGGLAKMAAEAESILEDVSNIGKILPTPAFEDLMHIMAHGQESTSSEACCQNFEECHNQCVPRAEHWKWRAKEAEKKVKAYQWHMQWTIPDVTCNTEPVKPAEPKPSGPPNRRVPLM